MSPNNINDAEPHQRPTWDYWTEHVWQCRGYSDQAPYNETWCIGLVASVAEALEDEDGLGWFGVLRPHRVLDALDELGGQATGPTVVAHYMLDHLTGEDLDVGDVDTVLRRGLDLGRSCYSEDLMPPTTSKLADFPVNPEWGFALYLGSIAALLDDDGVRDATSAIMRNIRPIESAYREGIQPSEVAVFMTADLA